MLKKKTENGITVSAKTFQGGISVGIFDSPSVCSLEYDKERNRLVLLVNEDTAKKYGIEVIRVNNEWKPIEQEA